MSLGRKAQCAHAQGADRWLPEQCPPTLLRHRRLPTSHLQSQGSPLASGPVMGLNCRAWDAVSELPKASAMCTCDPGAVGVVWAANRVAIGVHPCPAAISRDVPRHACAAGVSFWCDKHAIWERPGGLSPCWPLAPDRVLVWFSGSLVPLPHPVAMVNVLLGRAQEEAPLLLASTSHLKVGC